MGSGAPSKYVDKSGSLATSSSNLEHWLMSAVDKEKQEKAWLAAKYEEKCDDMTALRRELDQLRSMLGPAGVSSTSSAAEVRPNSPLRGMQPAVMQKALGDVGWTRKAEGNADESTKASPSKLTDRRGLRLSVDISPSKKPSEAAEKVPPRQVAHAQPVVDKQPRQAAVEPSQEEAYRDEPMSALLRRRKEEWSLNSLPEKGDDDFLVQRARSSRVFNGALSPLLETQDTDLRVTKAVTAAPLSLRTTKFDMDLDCPISPKRAGKASAAAF